MTLDNGQNMGNNKRNGDVKVKVCRFSIGRGDNTTIFVDGNFQIEEVH